MPAIVKIGHQEYLVKSEGAAMAAVKALSGAVRVSYRYLPKSHLKYWFPDDEHQTEIGLEIIQQKQFKARKLAEHEDEDAIDVETKCLPAGKEFLLLPRKTG